MNIELFNAILSMDAYNRGYDASIDLRPRDQQGNLISDPGTNNPIESDKIGTKLGNATVYDSKGDTAAQDIGFYAIAYSYGGETIISYRGTDDVDGIPNPFTDKDVYHGWSLGSGNIDSEQGHMAIEFYNAVAGATHPLAAQISATGHSLGGGLAGLVAGLYDQDAELFDSMEFSAALSNFYSVTFDPTHSLYRADLKDLIYGADTPWSLDVNGINAQHMNGEALGFIQLSPTTPTDLGDDVIGLGAVDLHSMSTLTIRMFADTEIGGATDWRTAAKYFWPVMYDNNVGYAQKTGIYNNALVSGTLQTDEKYSDILRGVIAYSAIDEGNDAARPFGDTAIRALYDDANNMGAALISSGTDSVIETFATDISRVFVHYSAQLAMNDVEEADDTSTLAKDGVLDFSDPANNQAFSVNLSEDYWTSRTTTTDHHADSSRYALVTNIAIASNVDSIFVATSQLWGDSGYTAFDRVAFSSNANGQNIIAEPLAPTTKATLFIGSVGDDVVTGSSANELILGGIIGGVAGSIERNEHLEGREDGDDTLNGGGGNDILIGGFGDDVLSGGLGTNILNGYGGDALTESFYGTETTGFDTADYSWFTGGVTVSVDSEGDGTATGAGISDTLISIDHIVGSTGGDTIHSSVRWAEVTGGLGDDVLSGAYKYYYNQGDGNDTIIANDGHTGISLLDYSSGSMNFTVSGNDYVIGLSDGAQITIQNFFDGGYDNILGIAASNTNIGITEWYGEGDSSYGLPGAGRTFSEWRQSNGDLHGSSVDDSSTPEIDESKDSLDVTSSYIIIGFDDDGHEIREYIDDFDVFGFGGNDSLIVRSEGDNDILGGDGHDNIESYNGGDDFIDGGEGHDHIESHDGENQTIIGGDGTDFIKIYSSVAATIYGGGGADSINTYDGDNDVIYGEAGHDYISASGVGNSNIYGGDGNDVLAVHHVGENYVDGGEGNDEIRAYSFDSSVVYSNALYGRNGDDDIRGSSGEDTIYGGEGNDVLFTSDLNAENTGTDILKGEAGDDILLANGAVNNMYGGTGNDVFIHYGNNLDSSDVRVTNIYDTDGHNLLVFSVDSEIYRPQDLLFQSSGISDLQITFRGSNQVILVDDYYNNLSAFQHLALSYDDRILDGISVSDSFLGAQTWFDDIYLLNDFIQADQSTILGTVNIDIMNGTSSDDRIFALSGNDTIYGFAGKDFLLGDDGDDFIDGGEGNDLLRGGEGVDTILGGDGNDEIAGNDGDDTLSGNGGSDAIYGGTGLDDLQGGSGEDVLHGGDGNDELSGGDDDDVIFGDSGDDVLNGGDGNDELYGGSVFTEIYDPPNTGPVLYDGINELYGDMGNDTLYGGVENDILDGGFGDDLLYGGVGSDNLIFTYGQSDILGDYYDGGDEFSLFGGSIDKLVLRLSTGEASDANLVAEILDFETNILDYDYGNFFHFTSLNLYASSFEALEIQTTYNTINGTTSSETLTGTANPDEIFGLDGDDTLIGKAGDDVLRGELGDDILKGDDGDDELFGGDGEDDLRGHDGNDKLHGGADNDLLGGYDGNDELHGDDGDDEASGGTGSDTIHGGAGNDLIRGNEDADVIYGDDGNDEIYGDTTYDDGWGAADEIHGGEGNDTAYGSRGDDMLYGDGGVDSLYGGYGDDDIWGGIGNDILRGDRGHDEIYGGEGDDTINGNRGDDYLYGGAGNDTIEGGEGHDHIYGGDGDDTLKGDTENDVLYGENGSDLLRGHDDQDILFGGADADQLEGYGGNDKMIGGGGSDTQYGYSGQDLFYFDADAFDGTSDNIMDFALGDYEKIIVMEDVLTGYDAATSAIADFVQITTSGNDTLITVDRDGTGTAYSAEQIATVHNVTGLGYGNNIRVESDPII